MTNKARRQKATDYEKVTAKIYEILSPGCRVVQNDMIHGRESGMDRQIDVSIRSQIAGHDVLVIVQCKDFKSKVNVVRVGEFLSVIRDVGASKGVMVTSTGFTKGARTYAKSNGIDLCHIHDAETRNWSRVIEIPVVIEKVTPTLSFNFKFTTDGNSPLNDDSPFKISDIDVLKHFSEKWNNGKIDLSVNKSVFDLGVEAFFFRDANGKKIDIKELQINVSLEKSAFWCYFSQLPHSKAVENTSTGQMNLIISEKDFENVSSNLHFLKHVDDIPIKSDVTINVLTTPNLNLLRGPVRLTKIG